MAATNIDKKITKKFPSIEGNIVKEPVKGNKNKEDEKGNGRTDKIRCRII
jgi:hypothetical protein